MPAPVRPTVPVRPRGTGKAVPAPAAATSFSGRGPPPGDTGVFGIENAEDDGPGVGIGIVDVAEVGRLARWGIDGGGSGMLAWRFIAGRLLIPLAAVLVLTLLVVLAVLTVRVTRAPLPTGTLLTRGFAAAVPVEPTLLVLDTFEPVLYVRGLGRPPVE